MIDLLRRGDEMLGDDLGTREVLGQTVRFHWRAIPFLRNLKCSPAIYGRMCYYPKVGEGLTEWKKHIRLSTGIGLGFEMSPEMTLLFYYNVGSFFVQKGDHARETFGITFTLF